MNECYTNLYIVNECWYSQQEDLRIEEELGGGTEDQNITAMRGYTVLSSEIAHLTDYKNYQTMIEVESRRSSAMILKSL